MQSRVHPHGGNAAIEEGPVVAAPHQLRRVVVVAKPQGETDPGVRLLDRLFQRAAARRADDIDRVLVRLGGLDVEAAEPVAAVLRDLLVASDHVHVQHGDGLLERHERRLGVRPCAQQSAHF